MGILLSVSTVQEERPDSEHILEWTSQQAYLHAISKCIIQHYFYAVFMHDPYFH